MTKEGQVQLAVMQQTSNGDPIRASFDGLDRFHNHAFAFQIRVHKVPRSRSNQYNEGQLYGLANLFYQVSWWGESADLQPNAQFDTVCTRTFR